MKRLMITDTHVGYKNNDYWNNVHLNFFEELCQYAKNNNITELVHLGDFFDDRKNFNIKHVLNFTTDKIIPLLIDTFEKIYIIVGNHDSYLKDGIEINSLILFKHIPNFIIIKEPMVLDNMKLFPWGYVPSKDDKDYICRGHWEINGVVMNASGQTGSDFKTSMLDFKGIKKVESGHFHTPGTYGNIQYLGTPYHMNHNDRGNRGFYVIDNNDTEFIIYKNGPEFMDIFVSVLPDTDVSRISKINDHILISKNNDKDFKSITELESMDLVDNHIRLIYLIELGTNLTNDVNEKIHSLKPESVKIKFLFTDKDENNTENIVEVSENDKELLLKYIDGDVPPDHINKNILKGIIEQIIHAE